MTGIVVTILLLAIAALIPTHILLSVLIWLLMAIIFVVLPISIFLRWFVVPVLQVAVWIKRKR